MGNNSSGNLNFDSKFIFNSIKNLLNYKDFETLNDNFLDFRESIIDDIVNKLNMEPEDILEKRLEINNYINDNQFNLEPCKELQEIRKIIMEEYKKLSDNDKTHTHEISTVDYVNKTSKKEKIKDTYTLFQNQALNNAIIFESERFTPSSLEELPFGFILL
jgi:hypothetical protein